MAYGYDDVTDQRRRFTVLIGFVDLEEVESENDVDGGMTWVRCRKGRSMQLLLAKAPTKTTKNHNREARMDNVDNILVVLVVNLNMNRIRSNAQKRLTKDCSDQICTCWC